MSVVVKYLCIVRNKLSASINVGEKAQEDRFGLGGGRHARRRVISRGDDETTLSPLLSFSLSLSQPLTRVKSSSYARKLLGDASAEILISAVGSKILRAFCRLSTSGFGYNRFVDSTADDSSSSICGRPIRRVQRGCGKENLIVLSGSLVDKLSLCDRRNGYHSSFLLCP